MESERRKLPIGIQTFRTIREEGYYYADKTEHVRRLLREGTHFFLSRPRRFGKSLLLDTIKELFEGSEELFRGLAIHGDWEWSRRYPVVRLSFGRGDFTVPDYLHTNLMAQLDSEERRTEIASDYATGPERFGFLLEELHRRSGERVVVLVDEYDKPILDALGQPEVARANRDFLRGLYSVIKDCDAHVRFTLLTGVSKFSKVSLFSGLNNLIDITLDPEFATICGYTEADLDTVFAPEMAGLDRGEVREWYNGYSWRGGERVYNPFDVLLLCRRREFGAWWFETGTPTFLVDMLTRREVNTFELQGMEADERLLSSFDVDEIAVEALLFQTGYLTIEESAHRGGRMRYRLGYPNREVRQSLNDVLLERLAGGGENRSLRGGRLYDHFLADDMAAVEAEFRALFAGIPTDWHRRNNIARFEGYYASVLYAALAALGMALSVEDASSAGRLDLAMRFNGRVYLFEFKVVERAGKCTALEQLRTRGYADKYRHLGEPIRLVGIEFSEATRNLSALDVAEA